MLALMLYVLSQCPMSCVLWIQPFLLSLSISHTLSFQNNSSIFFFISYTFFRSIVERLSIVQYSYSSSFNNLSNRVYVDRLCVVIIYVYINVCVCVLYEFWGLHLSFYHFEFSIIHLFRYCWDNIVAVTVVANTLHKYLILLLPLMWTWIYVV